MPDMSDDNYGQYVSGWRYHFLSVIPAEFHTPEEKQWFGELTAQRGVSDHPTFLIYTTHGSGAWVRTDEEAPNFSELGPEEFLNRLRSNSDEWYSLRALATENLDEAVALTRLLQSSDIVRAWPLFDHLEQLLRQGQAVPWLPILELAERIDPSNSGRLAALIREGIANDVVGIPPDLQQRALGIAVRGLEATATPLDAEPPGDELLSHHLNSFAGQYADAILITLHRIARTGERNLPTEAEELIGRALENGWGGIEFRFALGRFVGVVEWFRPEFVTQNVQALCPLNGEQAERNATRAFFGGTLVSGSLNPQRLEALAPVYRDALLDLSVETRRYFGEHDRMGLDALIEHVVIGWIWDVPGYGFDGLLGEMSSAAPDDKRQHIVWYLGSEFKGAAGEHKELLRRKMLEYWTQRVQASRNLPVVEQSEELTAFSSWPGLFDLSLQEAEEKISATINHLKLGFALKEILEYLADHARSEPTAAVRLLELLVVRWASAEWLRWDYRHLLPVLQTLSDSITSNEDKERLRSIASRLMEAGVLGVWPLR
jgi:hypothetical protein